MTAANKLVQVFSSNPFRWILQSIKAPGLPGHCLAWVFGALYPLAFSPFDITALAWLSVIGYALSLDSLPPKQAAIRSWFYGFGLYVVGVSWVYVSMHDYGYTPTWLAIPLMITFTAGLGLLFMIQGYLYRRLDLNNLVLIGLPATWIIFEWLKTWLLSGFPWLFIGSSQIDNAMGGYLPVMGIFGTGFMVTFCCSFWVFCLQRSNLWQTREPLPQPDTLTRPASINKPLALGALVTTITVLSVGFAFKDHSWITVQTKDPINVSLMQGNISQDRKWLPEELVRTKTLYKTMTEAEWHANDTHHSESDKNWHADLVIWPEAAIPQFFHEAQAYIGKMNELALNNNSTLITGILFIQAQSGQYQFFNGIFAVGHGSGFYFKQKLVPFGEYIPFEKIIRGIIPFFDLPMSNISPGKKEQLPLKVKGNLFATFICYEIVYPEFVRRYAKKADFLLTISNDAWFGSSHGPHQHFQMARVRALENGKFLLRATNTGITAIVDPFGKVLAQAPQKITTALRGTVYKTTGETPYSRMGSQVLIDICFVLIVIAWAYGRHKKNKQ